MTQRRDNRDTADDDRVAGQVDRPARHAAFYDTSGCVPGGPDDASDETRDEGAVSLPQGGARDPSPAQLLVATAPDEDIQVRKRDGRERFDFAPVQFSTEQEVASCHESAQNQWESERGESPARRHAPPEHLREPALQTPTGQIGHGGGRDRWPEASGDEDGASCRVVPHPPSFDRSRHRELDTPGECVGTDDEREDWVL